MLGAKQKEAAEAIRFALEIDCLEGDGMAFLRTWHNGDAAALAEWPEWIARVPALPDGAQQCSFEIETWRQDQRRLDERHRGRAARPAAGRGLGIIRRLISECRRIANGHRAS